MLYYSRPTVKVLGVCIRKHLANFLWWSTSLASALRSIRPELLDGVLGELRVHELVGRQGLVDRAPLDELPLRLQHGLHIQPPVGAHWPPGHLIDELDGQAGVCREDRRDDVAVLALGHERVLVAQAVYVAHRPAPGDLVAVLDEAFGEDDARALVAGIVVAERDPGREQA